MCLLTEEIYIILVITLRGERTHLISFQSCIILTFFFYPDHAKHTLLRYNERVLDFVKVEILNEF